MLVLSRKAGQRIVIDDKITVLIHRVNGNRVSIGIEAPEDIHIMRGELQKIRQEFADDEASPRPAGDATFGMEFYQPPSFPLET